MSDISFKTEVFEGPLDLLLHLISKNKIDIYDIPVAMITSQYMEYIGSSEIDMENISEFLVMAATLLELKARMLLPKPEAEPDNDNDPRKELVEKLLEYKLCKYMSMQLKDRASLSLDIFYGQPHIPEEVAAYKQPVDTMALLDTVTMSRLQDLFVSMMSKKADRLDPVRHSFKQVEKDEVTMEQQIERILTLLEERTELSFEEIFEGNYGRMRMIVSFLALLELIRMNRLVIRQEAVFADIIISRAVQTEL